jgi:hypothetical protein
MHSKACGSDDLSVESFCRMKFAGGRQRAVIEKVPIFGEDPRQESKSSPKFASKSS